MSRFHRTDFDMLPEQAFKPRFRGGPMTLEGGGKGSSAPPPDPRLIAAQIRSMGIQDTAIQQMMEQQRVMQPLQMDQLKFGLDSARTAFDQSQSDRTWMLSRRGMLSGLQDRMASDANEFDGAVRRDELAATATADTNAAFANVKGQQMRGLQRLGVNPNSGRALAMDTAGSLAQSTALANSANMVRQAARAEGYSLTDRAQNALAGYPAMGMQATGQGAGFGMSGVGLTNSAWGTQTAGSSAINGAAASLGNNATSMWGQQAQYKSSQDQIAASSDPTGTILGAVAGMGMAYATGGMSAMGAAAAKGGTSDIRLKEDIVRVGTLDNGLPVYTFRYKWGGPTVMGVMAHEVKELVPEAFIEGGHDGFYHSVDYSKLGG